MIFIYNIIYNIRKVSYNLYESYWRYFAFNRWQQPLVCSFVLALFFTLALELFTCISISIKLKTQNSFSSLVGNQNVLSKNCEMYADLVRSKSDALLTFYSSVLKPKPFKIKKTSYRHWKQTSFSNLEMISWCNSS